MNYVIAGYASVLSILVAYAVTLVVRQRRLTALVARVDAVDEGELSAGSTVAGPSLRPAVASGGDESGVASGRSGTTGAAKAGSPRTELGGPPA